MGHMGIMTGAALSLVERRMNHLVLEVGLVMTGGGKTDRVRLAIAIWGNGQKPEDERNLTEIS